MNKRIKIRAGHIELTAELNETKTASAIGDALPLSGKVNLWGKEIYFSIPLSIQPENGQEIVQSGDLGYWPTGTAFCIFFGPTPASNADEIRPASAVNVFGKVLGDVSSLNEITTGSAVTIEKAD